MTRPETPFEQVSYDLNKFRERRMAERRTVPRSGPDRRAAAGSEAVQTGTGESGQQPDRDTSA